jgi:hypothetical protein
VVVAPAPGVRAARYRYANDPTASGNTIGNDNNGGGGVETVQLNGATVRVTWESSNGGDTATLGKFTGPDA